MAVIKLGTRASALAMAQSALVADQLRARGAQVELIPVRTDGDISRASLTGSGLGVFAGALREALLAGHCDIAVHSAKDLPVAPIDGLVLAAVPPRADTADALCSRNGLPLAELASGARIGTGSPRRAAQLRACRPDLHLVDIRGNVGTRLARLAADDLDAVVLAMAGLIRLGLADRATERLDLLPAPGQGCLAVECRTDDMSIRELLSEIDHWPSRTALTAERILLAQLQAGCSAPIGARCEVADERVQLTAAVFAPDGQRHCRGEASGYDAATVGIEVARQLRAKGADLLPGAQTADRTARLAAFHDDSALWRAESLTGLRVLFTGAPNELSGALANAGAVVEAIALTRPQLIDGAAAELAAALATGPDYLVLTSARTVTTAVTAAAPTDAAIGSTPTDTAVTARPWPVLAGTKVAAVGQATARAARQAGLTVDLIPAHPLGGAELAAALPEGPGRILLPCSQLADPALANRLRAKGWQVQVIALYTMQPQPVEFAGYAAYDVVVMTAGSAARALVQLAGAPPAHYPVICLGPPTARVCASLGLTVTAIPPHPDAEHLIRTLAELGRSRKD